MRVQTVAAGVAIVVVVAAVATGLVMLGPPSAQRALRLDERRSASLRALQAAVDEYWIGHGQLPKSIGDLLNGPRVLYDDPKDPVTRREYRYRMVTATSYELCADFERPSPPDSSDRFWTHGAGTRCFVLEVRGRAGPR